ncbi:MAG: Gfo/Idh/MocA family oxidoreductase [Woeseiaceae bacterium]|nr:Gfo/Idh/MocA family oxidoreductase [Woeseiaceae bacterium]
MKRRDFLITGGAIAASVGLGSTLASARAPSDQIGIGIIGVGSRGKQHFKFLQDVPMLKLVANCDVLPFRLDEAKAAEPGVRTYVDYRDLLNDKDVDAVIVSTHFSEHHPVVLAALDAGKHIYCEKTMIKGIDETREIFDATQKHPKQIFQTGFQYRTSPLFEAAARSIRNGDIGRITAINCQWNRNGNWRRPVPNPKWERHVNWRMYREYSGGLVAELCSHQMGFCDWVIGSELQQIQGVGGIDFWVDGRETYDNVHVVTRYKSGVTATYASQTTNSLDGFRIAVLGKKGTIILTTNQGWTIPEGNAVASPDNLDLVSGALVDGWTGASIVGPENAYRTANERFMQRIDAPTDDPTPVALQKFAEAIRDRRQPVSNAASGAKLSAMVQSAIDAMDGRKVIPWRAENNYQMGP